MVVHAMHSGVVIGALIHFAFHRNSGSDWRTESINIINGRTQHKNDFEFSIFVRRNSLTAHKYTNAVHLGTGRSFSADVFSLADSSISVSCVCIISLIEK